MSDHPAIDKEHMFLAEQQTVTVTDSFRDDDLILDLGGGGEGVIGQLRGRQVVAVDMRKQELEDCAPGPIKVVADAKELPFLDEAFDAITAFFFLMYVPESDRASILAEAYRVLRPGGQCTIWDAMIPSRGERTQDIFIVPVKAELPDRAIETGYGVRWEGHEMTVDDITQMAQSVGFIVVEEINEGEHFRLTLARKSE
jgi:ubiquinone/menaquinone biosynthesis C-methylase UbiE